MASVTANFCQEGTWKKKALLYDTSFVDGRWQVSQPISIDIKLNYTTPYIREHESVGDDRTHH